MGFVPKAVEELVPYKAGKPISELMRERGLTRVVKLASNENPLGPSPRAVEAAREVMDQVHLYPDPGAFDLKSALCERFNLGAECITVGAGSESIMSNIVRTFFRDGEEVLTSENTFIGWLVLCRARGLNIRTVPMTGDYRFDLSAMADAIGPKTRMVYLANPNNPTGTYFTVAEWEAFLNKLPDHVLVILDEAYFEYAEHLSDYPNSMSYRHDQVITLRTFSKAHGLAGMRVGYGFANARWMDYVNRVKLPFEPPLPSQAAAVAALRDIDHMRNTLETNDKGMMQLVKGLEAVGLPVVPSAANFIYLPLHDEERRAELVEYLLSKGVIVRGLEGFHLPGDMRVTIGTEAENDVLLEELQGYFAMAGK